MCDLDVHDPIFYMDAAADEMIEYLRSENDMLGKQVSGLRSEMALIRHVSVRKLFSVCKIFK